MLAMCDKMIERGPKSGEQISIIQMSSLPNVPSIEHNIIRMRNLPIAAQLYPTKNNESKCGTLAQMHDTRKKQHTL